ncbi:MAG TPA: serpin family protein, partial [Polyangiaceae bacterium]|nr:serpin family protein [Polyangiaceae bacterium]
RLFGQSGVSFAPDFLGVVANDYGAPLEQVDFAQAPEAARQQINAWISEQTRTRVPELIAEGKINENTELVLANAIYFKADWAQKFDVGSTGPAPFRLADGSEVQVPTMNRMGTCRLASDSALDVLEMNYQDDELSMVVLLPKSDSGLPALEATFSPEYVDSLLSGATEQEMGLSFPRFELGAELPLADLLKSLGIRRAFEPDQADFTRMIDPTVSMPYLGFAVHKAYVKVDEEGTEAAAASAAGTTKRSAVAIFAVNHPFVYLIRDRLTGAVLFMGRMADPTQASPG